MINKYNVVSEDNLKKMKNLDYNYLPNEFPIYIGIKLVDGCLKYFKFDDNTPDKERFKLFVSKEIDDADDNKTVYVMSSSNCLDAIHSCFKKPMQVVIASSDSFIELIYSTYWFLIEHNLIDDIHNLKK